MHIRTYIYTNMHTKRHNHNIFGMLAAPEFTKG
jgi:hypothetical protein